MLRKTCFFLLLVLLACGVVGYNLYRSGNLQKAIVAEVGKNLTSDKNSLAALPTILGFDGPRNYLILFLNNTEIRPGGGFIGAYGVVTVEKGKPQIIKIEGTEILDSAAGKNIGTVPPNPIKDYVGVESWYFRDSNWSPDFAVSARQSLELYQKENGVLAEKIDGVIGFTPTLIEEVLKIIGPLSVNNEQFTAQNFTEKLEYEVEYGYTAKGQTKPERKQLISDLAAAFLDNTKSNIFKNWSKYLPLMEKMIQEKQLMVWSSDKSLQTLVSQNNWSGEMKSSVGDYVLWVDANLGALKTDVAIIRELDYSIIPSSTTYIATAKMKFIHNGVFDWRTTRYRDYARVYVPTGSKLIKTVGSMEEDRSLKTGVTDSGIENDRQWFGAFIAIEPGKIGELTFQYILPQFIVDQIKAGEYNLLAQKQLGMVNAKLNLNLDFGKSVMSAAPGEDQKNWGNNKYNFATDWQTDKTFSSKIKN
ncbi:MAG: hypothetical protein US58_C0009G0013 [Candidatus Magasanikbacteria bacterium GW2011_GWA2_37_8]|uniref:DUF4012 domain-containing protein n=1 Tax=Candidatus Magasanikbacteria bacterium GW2011_GWA2_37_8 TaxID=1619036 RepID=A0A0G0HCM8_9BACT|nr:MAG: hypothetical protein US58_C0009G0013 [Candidatus Magasanikbacteria bacterium GW2011_GWA2_37_8]